MLIGELSLSSQVGRCLVAHTNSLCQNIVWVHRTTLHHSCVDLSKNRNRHLAHMVSPVYNDKQPNNKLKNTLLTCYRCLHHSPLRILHVVCITFLEWISLCRNLLTNKKYKLQNKTQAQMIKLILHWILKRIHFVILKMV